MSREKFNLREWRIALDKTYDMLIIGGGINGTAIARDAAGRGLSVCLCEKDDLANHTSSASTKLVHGGLRYLEHYEFRLVRESLKEREVLLRAAPHIIWPMRFVLPYDEGLRPKWMLRAGLFLYDSLGGRELLPGTKTKKLDKAPHLGVLESRLKMGFEYSDCWVEDSRLVVLNAVDASKHGAKIKTHHKVMDLTTSQNGYVADIRSKTGETFSISAKAVINAAGPWVEEVLLKLKPGSNTSSLRLVKGSHIVTKRLFDGDHAYIFQNEDERIIFAIPYENDYTLIGTTDVPFEPHQGPAKASDEEISYLCDAANEYFENDISPSDVVWTYSGVRPLYDDKSADASEVTRDYVLNIEEFAENSPFLSVYGGKITTSRKLAEHVMEKLSSYFDKADTAWTRDAHLPGGNIKDADFDRWFDKISAGYNKVDPKILFRLCRAYGTRVNLVFRERENKDLGQMFGDKLSEAEAQYLVAYEWATSADDILWRRTKLGLHMSPEERDSFARWFESAF